MKNLVIDLLIKMAKADVQTKELTAQVEAILSAPVASAEILSSAADLLLAHFDRLISVSHFVEENADNNLAHH
ncbi:MAG: sigma-S stabilization anti-adapter protein IraP [Sodalis sp. (in: enterobacteria)]|uniref:sigma-S stabilization anti-adapter protein IraP n=1 Tax=Sodalis sp. (in: enterobacteria) TaxID=1898979 RepID=UPI0039E4593F